jgi:hypothetical protein
MDASDPISREGIWMEICSGFRCALCEAELADAPREKRFHYCTVCVPDPRQQPVNLLVNIMHGHGAVHVAFLAPDGRTSVGPSLRFESREKAMKSVDRGRTSAAAREEALRAIQQWGRTSVNVCLDDAQSARLLSTGVLPPRKSYELQQQTNAKSQARSMHRVYMRFEALGVWRVSFAAMGSKDSLRDLSFADAGRSRDR